jgi:hypothetical protein
MPLLELGQRPSSPGAELIGLPRLLIANIFMYVTQVGKDISESV